MTWILHCLARVEALGRLPPRSLVCWSCSAKGRAPCRWNPSSRPVGRCVYLEKQSKIGSFHANILTCSTLTGSQRESNSAEELVARQSVVIPYRELQRTFGQLRQWDVLVDEGVVPNRRIGTLHHRRFLLGAAVLVWKKITKEGRH